MTTDSKFEQLLNFEPVLIRSPTESQNESYSLKTDKPAYLHKTISLLKEYSERSGEIINIEAIPLKTAASFLEFLNSVKRRTLKQRSWKFYKYAVSYCFGSQFGDQLLIKTETSAENLPARTSSKRSNFLNRERQTALFDILSRSESKYADMTKKWILATIHTGLRPQEWISSTIIYHLGNPILKVKTIIKGKPSEYNHRAHRYIPLNYLSFNEFNYVRFMCDMLSGESSERYKAVYNQCRNVLGRASIAAFGIEESVSLYTARQQFAANLKKSISGQQKTLAIQYAMGHSNEETQRHHYAPTYNGDVIDFPSSYCIEINELYENKNEG